MTATGNDPEIHMFATSATNGHTKPPAAPASPNGSAHAIDDDLGAVVQAARAGDVDAFDALYDRFARRVYAYCLARVHRPADAEDLTQLTFLKVVEALPRYELRASPFAGWLFTLARNAVIDFVRSRREHLALDELRDARFAGDGSDWPAPELDGLTAALPFLTADQYEVVASRFFAGLSVRETARVMGRDEAAVRALQYRAIGSLRRRLAPDRPRASLTGPGLRTVRARVAEP